MTGAAASGQAVARFPPGFWRRIIVQSSPGLVVAALEDDVHRFVLRLAHFDEVITGADARAERFPWSACPAAGGFLAERLVGSHFAELLEEDPRSHCTHLLDLASIAAAHAGGSSAVTFDLRVDDRQGPRTTASLLKDGNLVLQWQLDGMAIIGPDGWAGRDLKSLSTWRGTLAPELARQAAMLRRAVFVSGVRRQPATGPERAADRGPQRLGACFSYQLPRALDARNSEQPRIDFSTCAHAPLEGFQPDLTTPIGETTYDA